MSGLGQVQKKVLAGTRQGIVLLHRMKGSPSSLSRAVRSLERRGLVRIWKVRVPVRSGNQQDGGLRKITVVAPPEYHQKHVVGEAFGLMCRNANPDHHEITITVVTPPGYHRKHVVRRAVRRMRGAVHPARRDVRITVVTPRGYHRRHVVEGLSGGSGGRG